MEKETIQKNGYEYTFTDNGVGMFYATVKKINPKTGKGWQSGKVLYNGTNKLIAMRTWLYSIAKA